MKEKNPYLNFSSFVLRSPLFPFNFIEAMTSGESTTEEQIREVCQEPVVDEAIFLASPDLHSQLHEWLDGNLTDKKKVSRLHYSLMRYILRMCTRPTPFGLFAGFNVGEWGKETDIEIPPQKEYSRHTRLDMNYLCALAQDLAKHPDVKEKIKYYPNSSAYIVGNQLRYVEYRYQNARRTHHIVAVDYTDYLECVLNEAAKGAYLNDLAQLLVADDITLEDAKEFIDELINSQLLVNELEPAITGPEFFDQILAVLKKLEGIDHLKDIIVHTQNLLQEIDDSTIGETVSYYKRIAKDLEPLGTGYELKFLFQTDMVKPRQKCNLEWTVAADVLMGLEVLNKLSLRPSATTLTQFRDAFSERYETRELPLLQTLDTESGVGYRQTRDSGDIAPLVDDLAIPGTGDGSQDLKWNRVQSFLFKKYRDAIEGNQYEIELTDNELESFEATWKDLPDTMACMVQIVADKSDENPRARILLSGSGGSSAGNLLGRFCHADKATDTFVKEITKKEEEMNPNVIMAEIIHLPESRVGNVLIRPVLRDHEIPYLAKSAVADESQIKPQDLYVSVRGNRIMLRSQRLNKEVIPRLTNAHNYSHNALPFYHFLADMQTQNLRGGVGFNWGSLANEYPFLPRVTYKNLIFSPATWNIKSDEISELLKIEDGQKLLQAVREWREKNRMPGFVLLADSDNKLFINLDNIMCIETLFSVTKNRNGFQLTEFLYDTDHAIVKGADGFFTNEFVFCFYNAEKLESANQS